MIIVIYKVKYSKFEYPYFINDNIKVVINANENAISGNLMFFIIKYLMLEIYNIYFKLQNDFVKL